MAKFSAILMTAAMVFTLSGTVKRFDPKPVMKRYCKLDKSGMQQLFVNGKANFEIVAGSSRFSRMAAGELAEILEKSLGVKLQVRNRKSGKKAALIVGNHPVAKSAGIDPARMEWGGFRIKSFKGDIILAGFDNGSSSMGTFFAVYDFLERFVGVRFYFPGPIGTVIPKLAKWSVPLIDISDRPDMQHRVMYCVDPFPGTRGKIKWYDKTVPGAGYVRAIRQYRLQNGTPLQSCHGLAHLAFSHRFGKSRPDFFALDDRGGRIIGGEDKESYHRGGQLCLSSEDLAHEIYLDAKAILTGASAKSRNAFFKNGAPAWPSGNQNPGFFNIMPNDSFTPCRCARCKPHYVGIAPDNLHSQAATDFIWGFKTRIAQKIKDEKIPGFLLTMSYAPYAMVPNVEIPENMLVMIGLSGPWSDGTPRQAALDARLKAWNKKLGARPYIWTYVTKYSAMIPLIPNSTPKATGRYFKRVSPYIFGAFLEAESDQWIYGYLNYFIFGKVMWDSKADVEKLLKEHHQKMFGPAASEMEEFFNTLERHWMKEIVGRTVEGPRGPVTVKPSDFMLWREIYTPQELNRLEKLLDKARAATARTPEFRQRVEFMREKFFVPLRQGAEKYLKSTIAVNGWRGVMPELAAGEKILIDGKAQEKAWKKAKAYFLLPNPEVKSEAVDVRTSFKALRDKENFYFFINCEEPLTSEMVSIRRKYDDPNIWQDNDVEIFLNPDCSRKGGYQLIFNSSGSLSDNRFLPLLDWKWNSGAQWRINVVPGKSWSLELKLPRKNMTPAKEKIVFNVLRSRYAGGKRDPFQTWSPQARQGHDVENFGTLEFNQKGPESLLKGGDFTEKQIGNRLGKHIPLRWCSASRSKLIQDTRIFRTGGVSLRLDENCDGVVYYDMPFLKADTRYRINFYVKLDNIESLFQWGGGVCFTLDCGILPRKTISFPPNGKYVGTMPWTYQSFEFRTPKNLRQNRKRCYLHISRFKKYNRGTAWIDQVEIFELPEK